MNLLQNAFGNSEKEITALAARFSRADLDYAGMVSEQLANGIFRKIPKL